MDDSTQERHKKLSLKFTKLIFFQKPISRKNLKSYQFQYSGNIYQRETKVLKNCSLQILISQKIIPKFVSMVVHRKDTKNS